MIIACLQKAIDGGALTSAGSHYVDALTRQLSSGLGDSAQFRLFGSDMHEVGHTAQSGPDLCVESMSELDELLADARVDLLHDFGHTPVSHLMYLRSIHARPLPMTVNFDPSSFLVEDLSAFGCLARHDALICSTDALGQALTGCLSGPGGPAVYVIPCGAEVHPVSPEQKADARYLLDLPADAVVVTCLTDLGEHGTVDVLPLVHTFIACMRESPKARLVIAGQDSAGLTEGLDPVLRDLGARRAVFFWTDASAVARSQLLMASDVVVSPSDNPYSDNHVELIEAMSYGLPVIAADASGRSSVIRDGENALRLRRYAITGSSSPWLKSVHAIAPHDLARTTRQGVAVDCRQMAQHLSQLLRSDESRQRLAQGARNYVSTHHRWTQVLRRYRELWEHCANEQRGRACKQAERHPQGDHRRWVACWAQNLSDGLPGALRVLPTELGGQVLETSRIRLYKQLEDVIQPNWVREIVRRAEAGGSVRDLVVSVTLQAAQPDPVLEDYVLYHVMWCLKQGFLELGDRIE